MRTHSDHRNERGIVLLLALVALLLISAVAASLLYMTATESTLVGYQRSQARVFQAALGGVEEGRARLSTGDPSFIGGVNFNITFPSAPDHVLYIVNPGPGETINIATIRNAASPFYDWQYDREWGAGALAAATVANPLPPPSNPLNSDMIPLAGLTTLPEMQYKWIRITVLTERAANRDVNGDGILDNTLPILWESATNRMNILYGPPSTLVDRDGDGFPESQLDRDLDGIVESGERMGRPVYRVTALARHASTGTTRMVQYDVSAPFVNLGFPAAVSLIGTGAQCGNGPGICNPAASPSNCDSPTDFGPSNALKSRGQDQAPGAPPGDGGPAIGCTDPAACTDCINEIANTMRTANWTGNDDTSGTQTGDITAQSGPLATSGGVQFLINSIRAVADQTFAAGDTPPQLDGVAANDVIAPPVGPFGRCDATINNPKVTVFDGDITLSGAGKGGCGVLLVTGRLTVTGDWNWKGLILVLGEGNFAGSGTESMQGAQVIARIYCKDGDPAPCPCTSPPGPPIPNANCAAQGVLAAPAGSTFEFNGGGTGGWDYNSMYINNAFGSGSYRILAYREIGR